MGFILAWMLPRPRLHAPMSMGRENVSEETQCLLLNQELTFVYLREIGGVAT
jgi:hypothetical protein